ncbi:MAG: ABC transporter substrate-binding protein [Anaerolineales bacterium]|uniref:ABC transporter substrate-binding protein n=1 Tax=Candidatus Villigracilis vicinus TaxID=3140679 RepID=UPI0031362F98|nr:ABC transporter substrate-binding protein [Anaerolineales bacterium]
MKNTLFKGLSVLMLIGLLLAACGGAPAETEAPAADATEASAEATEAPAEEASGGTLTIGLPVEPETLDPGDAVYVQEQFILMNLFDSLLSISPDGELHPGLATAWEPNADYSEFTFTLRQDVTFHDGTPFTAEAVKASFDHINSDAVLESGGKSLLQDHSYVETVVVDDYTVTVKFGASYPLFLRDASRQWLSISSPVALEASGADYGRNPVGTGPFKFVQWDAQSQIVLERNPDYNWGPEFAAHQGPANLEQVVFRILPEAATRLTAFETGEVLIASEPPALDAIALADSGAAAIQTFAQPGVPAILMINATKAPTDNVNVRKAMILAVNQEELAQTAFQELGLPATSVISPTTWAYDEGAASLYSYNPEEAARLLDEAGWVDADGDGVREKDGETLTIDWPDNPAWSEAFNELLIGYLSEAGFDVQYRSMDDGAAYEELLAGNYTLVYMYWTRPDPSPLRYLFHSENANGGGAWTNFVNEDLDNALADADTNTDEAARAQDYAVAQNIIMENALVLPMFTVNTSYITAPAVQGFSFDLEGYPYLYDISISE